MQGRDDQRVSAVRDALDQNLGLVVDVKASVLLENQLDVRKHLERNGELALM